MRADDYFDVICLNEVIRGNLGCLKTKQNQLGNIN